MPNNLTDTEENRLLSASLADGDLLVLVSALGSDSVAGTEIAGGGYARQSMGWGDPAGGSRTTDAAVTFSDMPAGDVKGWEVWDSTGTTRRWWGLLSPQIGSASAAASTINATTHNLVDGLKVVFQPGYAPGGLNAGQGYFVRDASVNSFRLSTTLGGAVLPVADTGLVAFGQVLALSGGQDILVPAGSLTCAMS